MIQPKNIISNLYTKLRGFFYINKRYSSGGLEKLVLLSVLNYMIIIDMFLKVNMKYFWRDYTLIFKLLDTYNYGNISPHLAIVLKSKR